MEAIGDFAALFYPVVGIIVVNQIMRVVWNFKKIALEISEM